MPRASVASLSVPTVMQPIARLEPPPGLSESERGVFLEAVLSCRPDHFQPADKPAAGRIRARLRAGTAGVCRAIAGRPCYRRRQGQPLAPGAGTSLEIDAVAVAAIAAEFVGPLAAGAQAAEHLLTMSAWHWRGAVKAIDRAALKLAIKITRNRDPERRRQIDSMLADPDREWDQVARFASYSCQCDALKLKPWETPPVWIRDVAEALGSTIPSVARAAEVGAAHAGVRDLELSPVADRSHSRG